jgi:putative hydrolase
MQEALAGGMFEPRSTPEQQAALTRLETILALVEGWVDEVVGQATIDRMPSAAPLREAVRRRRAAGGPAEQTFASLVGLELRPRRLRDAATLWGALRDREGAAARDAVWAHPDLAPTAENLDDPLGFRPGAAPAGEGAGAGGEGDDMDAALRQLLDDDERGSAGT